MHVLSMPEITPAKAPEAQKRKLSVGEARPEEETKRHKADEHDDATLEARDGKGKDEDAEDEDDEEEEDEEEEEEDDKDSSEVLDGPGPHVFMCWADAIFSLVGPIDDQPYLTLKSTAVEAWRKVAHLPKAERYEALSPHMDNVRAWELIFDEEGEETPSGQLLSKAWEDVLAKEKSTGGRGWWYEVTVQREKPAEGSAGLEIEFDGGPKGKWWITGFAITDKEAHDAMSDLVDYTCAWFS